MTQKHIVLFLLFLSNLLFAFTGLLSPACSQLISGNPVAQPSKIKHYLYVATPGIRDYLGYGGHGILVFDIDNNHRFVKRINTAGFHPDKTPFNVKGIAVSF